MTTYKNRNLKVTNLLDTISDNVPRFITKKWVEVHDQSGSAEGRYKPSKQIIFKTSVLQSDLYDFTDTYIVVKGTIIFTKTSNRSRKNRPLAFKNNSPFLLVAFQKLIIHSSIMQKT